MLRIVAAMLVSSAALVGLGLRALHGDCPAAGSGSLALHAVMSFALAARIDLGD